MMTSANRNNDDSEETYQNKGKNTNKNNGRGNVQSSSSCSSEDDSNASQESNGREIGTEKTRAGRGAATDPQSIYARVSLRKSWFLVYVKSTCTSNASCDLRDLV